MTLKTRILLLLSVTLPLLTAVLGVRAMPGQGRSDASSTLALSDWKTYMVKGEEFSVSLPDAPAMTTQTVDVSRLVKDRRQRVIGAYADGVVYSIYTFDNPNRRQSLDDLIAEIYGVTEKETPRSLSLGGFSGKEFEFHEADRKGVLQFYITEGHIYLFKAVGSSLGNPDIGIPKFISSIRIEKSPKGVEVIEGPGEPLNSEPSTSEASSEPLVLSSKEVTRRAVVITKPQPAYTEAAKQNQVEGTVVLKCIFSSSGTVTGIRIASGMPYGLTERAIAAARQIRFIPAIKDGHFVSIYIQLEYNFNLY